MANQQHDSKTLSAERFGQFAQGYVESQTHAKGKELERLVEIVQPQPDWVMLDVATGGGHTALKFAPLVAEVVASDIAPNMLAKAQAFVTGQGQQNVRFEMADAENLPFQERMFDLVTCRIAPHHFPDVGEFVREAYRALKDDGILLVQDQVSPENDKATADAMNAFEKLRDPSHNRALTVAEWQEKFEAAGFVVIHTEQMVKRHNLLHWAKLQDCTAEVIEELHRQLQEASPQLKEWTLPEQLGTDEVTFVNRHLIIAGRKTG
jgi:ubiquinone/menaquinone biosynthesis C-methylase UbiE